MRAFLMARIVVLEVAKRVRLTSNAKYCVVGGDRQCRHLRPEAEDAECIAPAPPRNSRYYTINKKARLMRAFLMARIVAFQRE